MNRQKVRKYGGRRVHQSSAGDNSGDQRIGSVNTEGEAYDKEASEKGSLPVLAKWLGSFVTHGLRAWKEILLNPAIMRRFNPFLAF